MSGKKIRVAVVYGGRSGEHEISCRSAKSIVEHLDRDKFNIIPVGIDYEGRWFLNQLSVLVDSADGLLLKDANSTEAIPHVDPTQKRHFDVVFPVLHGKWGEDGTLQGMLELADMPYVGCGVLSSAIGMDKDMAKRLSKQVGIPVLDYFVAYAHQDSHQVMVKAQREFTLPIFVKPANAGSSEGVSKVSHWDEFATALKEASKIDRKILIEQAADIRDLEMALLEAKNHAEPLVSHMAAEVIQTNTDFYSKSAKYSAESFPRLVLPADVTATQLSTMQDYAKRIFTTLECEGLARIDFFIDKTTGDVYFNEINTLPGFTAMSLYPSLWQASGLEYKELLSHLVELALSKK